MNEKDQKLVLDVLAGTVSRATHPALFDDDVVYFAIRKIETANFPWLLEQLQRAPSANGWRQVVSVLSPEHQGQAGTR
jgi:hypothetical protein